MIANATEVDRDNAKLYVQVSLKVTPTAYTDTTGNKELALEITPQYRVVASTADKADDIKLDGNCLVALKMHRLCRIIKI